jgi:hypothetical protein
VRSKAEVWGRLILGIEDSSSAESKDVLLLSLLCCVVSGLYDELITCSEQSYRECVSFTVVI